MEPVFIFSERFEKRFCRFFRAGFSHIDASRPGAVVDDKDGLEWSPVRQLFDARRKTRCDRPFRKLLYRIERRPADLSHFSTPSPVLACQTWRQRKENKEKGPVFPFRGRNEFCVGFAASTRSKWPKHICPPFPAGSRSSRPRAVELGLTIGPADWSKALCEIRGTEGHIPIIGPLT